MCEVKKENVGSCNVCGKDVDDVFPGYPECYCSVRCRVKFLKKENSRTCSVCGVAMWKGYVLDGGREYYCSDDCKATSGIDEKACDLVYVECAEDCYLTEWDGDNSADTTTDETENTILVDYDKLEQVFEIVCGEDGIKKFDMDDMIGLLKDMNKVVINHQDEL